jgi:flagellar biosynthesis/type III secretory pathway M-ring protein FliF/YscJ
MSYQEIQGHRLTSEQATDKWLRWGVRVGKGVLVLVVFAAILASVKQPLHEQNAMRAKVAGLEQQASRLQEDRDKLLRRLSWIQTDNGFLELEVRDRLHLQKGGEFVLRFED